MEDIAIYDFDPKLPKKAMPITAKAELEEDGSNLAIVLKRIMEDESAKRNFANLLQDLLPFVVDLDVERFADKSLLFSLREKFAENKPVPASFISDGTINVAALIVALYFEKKPVAIFEEPERNVHPHLISRIVGMMKEASQRKQVIVTTHNPEVVKNADIADVHLVSRDADGFSTITKPRGAGRCEGLSPERNRLGGTLRAKPSPQLKWLTRALYLFVEGDDDERFATHSYKPATQ